MAETRRVARRRPAEARARATAQATPAALRTRRTATKVGRARMGAQALASPCPAPQLQARGPEFLAVPDPDQVLVRYCVVVGYAGTGGPTFEDFALALLVTTHTHPDHECRCRERACRDLERVIASDIIDRRDVTGSFAVVPRIHDGPLPLAGVTGRTVRECLSELLSRAHRKLTRKEVATDCAAPPPKQATPSMAGLES